MQIPRRCLNKLIFNKLVLVHVLEIEEMDRAIGNPHWVVAGYLIF